MAKRVQVGNETVYDRYPDVFYVAQRYFEKRAQRPHILSFGCSTGEEVFCLAERYFPAATIVGVDASNDVLEVAARSNTHGDRLRFLHSTPSIIARNGPFDAIFAMSVLCRWPESGKVNDVSALYSFDEFSAHVDMLNANLKHGGLLTIYNSNFSFMDCAVSSEYDIVLSKHVRSNGFVKRFDRANKAITGDNASDCIFVKRSDTGNGASKGVQRILNEDGVLIGTLAIAAKI